MKKNYILLIAVLAGLTSFGQEIFDNSGTGDGSWTDDTNWADGSKPVLSSDIVEVAAATSQIDYDLTVASLDVGIAATINGPSTITIDINSTETGSGNAATSAVVFDAEGTNTFNLNANMVIDNTLTGNAYFKNQISTNKVNLGSTVDILTHLFVDNAGIFNMSGTFTQSGGNIDLRLDGTGTYNINSGFDATALQNIKLFGSGQTLNVNAGSDGSPIFTKVITSNSASNEGGRKTYNIVINNEDAFQLLRFQFFNYSTTNLTINENQDDFGELRIFTESYVNLTIASDKHIHMDGTAESFWKTGAQLNITGYDFDGANPSNVKFGSSDTALSSAQLLQITLVGGDHAGELVTLDENGYLILAPTAGASYDDITNFSMYPNPVEDELFILIDEDVVSLQVLDLLGNPVQSVLLGNGNVDVSNLISGVYVLRLETINGIATSKFVKK